MIRRRLIGPAIVVLVGIGGCASKPAVPKWIQSSQNQPAEPNVPKETEKKVDQMDARVGSADALAQKANAYTRELSPLVQARKGPTPTDVHWLDQDNSWPDGDELRLGGPVSHTPSDDPAARASVRPIIETSAASANQPVVAPVPVAPKPITVASATPARSTMITSSSSADSLSDRLAQQLKDSPRDVWAHMEYQLLKLLKDEPAPDLSSLATLPPEDRELVSVILDGLSNFRNGLRADGNMMLSGKIRSILEMSERLRSQAELTIPTIALCSNVNAYGNYDAIEPARFEADKEHRVIVYCEVANFLSNLSGKMWETKMTWDMTLYTAEEAIPVWSDKTETITDSSHVRRHDFFVRKLVTLPKSLPIGRYLLKVTIVDTQSNHVAEATTPLVVAAH